MPNKSSNVKNETQYDALNSSSQGGMTAQKKAAGRKGGRAAARKS
jgi:hypothetical protein